MTTVLGLEMVEEFPHRPTIRFLLDGTESLFGVDGHTERNRVADVLDTDALVPRAWPHRVALYGCGCGTFACSTLTVLISVDGRDVVWSDFRTVLTADVDAALPDHPRPRAVARLVAEARPWGDRPWQVLASWTTGDDVVWVSFHAGGRWHLWALPIGDGDTHGAADRLVARLAVSDPRGIPGAVEVWD